MTIELCVAACKAAGFSLAGVEYSQECWCDNMFNNGGGPAPDGSVGCNMPCTGNALEICGGSNRLDVYQDLGYVPVSNPTLPGYKYQGCYNEPADGSRALSASSTASNSMTVESCASFCGSTEYFGVEYGRECYCGDSIPSTSTLQPPTDCSFTCSGNSLEYCGAGGMLNIYQNLGYEAVSNPAPSAYSYQGCYNEPADGSRALSASSTASDTMTVESCASFCGDTEYFGVEYGRECYCGDSIPTTSTLQPPTDCSFTCSGNSLEYCGAGGMLNIYQNLGYEAVSNPTIAGYTYHGCYNEPADGSRALSASSTASNSMTVELCASFCDGANYFGVEYGRECYCGPSIPAASTLQSATDCSFTCAGNSLEYCGAGRLLNIYENNNVIPKRRT